MTTTTTLKVSKSVIDRLTNINEEKNGKLYGSFHRNSLVVLGLQVEDEDPLDLTLSFPAEVDLCGFFKIGKEEFNTSQVEKYTTAVDITDNPVFITRMLEDPHSLTASFVKDNIIEPVEFTELTERDIHSEFLIIRLRADIPLTSELATEPIRNAFTRTRNSFLTGKMIFTLPKYKLYFLGTDYENILDNNPSLIDLYDNSREVSDGVNKKKNSHTEIDVLNAFIMRRATLDSNAAQTPMKNNHGFVCIIDKKQTKTINITIPVDALAMVHKHTKVYRLYEILVETVIRNLRLYEMSVQENYHKFKDSPEKMSLPELFHFYPVDCGHFITQVYCSKETDEALYNSRLSLHKKLLLPLRKPAFKRANKYLFKEDTENVLAILNPHEGLFIASDSHEVEIVKGKYRYYHYCQDDFDDNGWGCAYRSLQTLASWFLLQGLTGRPVPTFKEIQKCLVDIGDKPEGFVGSRQWIGSMEVSFVLTKLLDVTCKTIYVSSGQEMASQGPVLLDHFRRNGSPVMIGGGVLAHTILGVQYNNQTGDIKFLILDPHYTGSEDLKVIQHKGWCGWKGVNFWNKSAYYNMCLPQVDTAI